MERATTVAQVALLDLVRTHRMLQKGLTFEI
jgi:hypothetical protein